MKKYLFIFVLFFLSACSPNEEDFKTTIPPLEKRVVQENIQENLVKATPTLPEKPLVQENIVKAVPIPPAINLKMPFYPQAPDGDWSMPWEEACEEAAVVLAYYFAIDQELAKDAFKAEILRLVDWEMKNFGYFESTSINQTYEMMLANFKIPDNKVWVLEDPTIESMKNQLAQGNVIIGPFAGRRLGNPFYSGLGPIYHMMVIKGYDSQNFITNDVGTYRGENFIYSYETIMNAMHEWNEEDILKGARKVIIVSPFS